MPDKPRLLRPVGPPLGLYLRPGRNDHTPLTALMAENRANLTGLVLDPCLADRHEDLRVEAAKRGLETVLDPRTVELSTVGGITRSGVPTLPWAGDALPHTPEMLDASTGDLLVQKITETVIKGKYSAVLAPTHYLAAGADGPWLEVDGHLTRRLRALLDACGLHEVCIYYPLATSAKVFRHATGRSRLRAALAALPVDAVWLRIHPFGTTSSGPLALHRYIEGCRDFHALGLPLVGEHTGTVGVALLAFGAVGGIESGITYGERYDVNPLVKPPANNDPFSPSPRVYVERLGTFLSREQAKELFANRQMKSLFACKVAGCCPRGASDMSADPRRHFVLRRTAEVATYSRPPEPVRAGMYLEDFLRPATDLALRATRVAPGLDSTRKRLEGWRQTLGAMHQQGAPSTFAVPPEGHRVQPRRLAAGE